MRQLLKVFNSNSIRSIRPFQHSVASHSYSTPAVAEDNIAENHQPGTTPELHTMAEFERHWLYFFRHRAFDAFEVQRGLNNCFAYDMVPPASVLEEALLAARRVHCLGTAVRMFGALRDKVTREEDYEAYLKVLKPVMDELGVVTPEALGRFD